MQSSPDWGSLVEAGRAKAYGIPWSDAEATALYEFKIPSDFVRNGVLTLAEYEVAKNKLASDINATGKKPLKYQTKEELMKLASELGINFTVEARRADLVAVIESVQVKLAQAPVPPSAAGSETSGSGE